MQVIACVGQKGGVSKSTFSRALAKAADLVVLPAGASMDDLRPLVRVAHSLVRAKASLI